MIIGKKFEEGDLVSLRKIELTELYTINNSGLFKIFKRGIFQVFVIIEANRVHNVKEKTYYYSTVRIKGDSSNQVYHLFNDDLAYPMNQDEEFLKGLFN